LTLHLKHDNELKSTWVGNLFQVLMTHSVRNVDRMQALLWRL